MSCLAEGAAEETFCVRSLGEPPSPHVLRCLWCGDSFSVELCDGQGVWRKEGCRRAAAHTSSDAEWMGRAREALAEGAHQVKVTTDESGNKRLGWVWEAGGATGAASTGTPYLARVLPDEVGAATFRLLAAAAAAAAAASLDAATARAGAAATRRELEKAVKAHSEAVAAKAATEQDLYAKVRQRAAAFARTRVQAGQRARALTGAVCSVAVCGGAQLQEGAPARAAGEPGAGAARPRGGAGSTATGG